MKKTAFWALPLAATLALTGCSGLLGSEESPAPSPAASSEATTPPAAESPSAAAASTSAPASATATVEETASEQDTSFGSDDDTDTANSGAFNGNATPDKQLSADDLMMVAQSVESYYEKGGVTILGDAELKASASKMEDIVANMNVTPEKCGGYASGSMTEMLSKMNMISIALPGDANATGTSISIGSVKNSSVLDDQLAKATSSMSDCSSFTLEMQGQKINAVLESGEASTNASTTLATMTEVEAAGVATKTLNVAGYDGVNIVSVSVVEPQDVEEAVEMAEEYIDLSLLHMAGA